MTNLHDGLTKIMDNYITSRTTEAFAGNNLGDLIRNKLPEYIYEKLELDTELYKVTGSIGMGNWAKVPWLSILYRPLTESTQKGVYIVYLFSEDMSTVYLTLNQGVTEPISSLGRNEGLKLLKNNANEIRSQINIKGFNIDDNIYLSDAGKGNDYQQSTIAYKLYNKNNLPNEELLLEDLKKIFTYYQSYIDTKDQDDNQNIEDEGFNYTVANLYLISGIINYLKDYHSVSKEHLIANHSQIIKSGEVKHPKNRVLHLCRLTRDLGLISMDYEVSLTETGIIYANNFDDDIWHLSEEQIYILVNYINKYPTKNPTIRAIHKALNIAKELGEFQLESFINLFARSLGKEKWAEATKLDKAKFVLNWLEELELIVRREKVYTINSKDIKLDIKDQINRIHDYILSKGFSFSLDQVTNLFLSLKTKPFVLLAGISGTGKSKLIKLFAEAVGASQENARFSLIPVRPDWNDGSDLLGYEAIDGTFRIGPLTKVLLDASKEENRDKPYFICLDEMNLSRVEHYFSDFLSIVESREKKDDIIKSDPILSHSSLGNVSLPDNVYIIGTVNMDETTHPFSKKVLDRANTIEFNQVELDKYLDLDSERNIDPVYLDNQIFRADFLIMKDVYLDNKDLVYSIVNRLKEINTILEKNHLHVGFRVRDEITFYMVYNNLYNLIDGDKAFDYQIMQKILPRIQGSSIAIKRLLTDLFNYLANINLNYSKDEIYLEMHDLIKQGKKYEQSLTKIAYMVERFEEDGFTSFWIA